MINLWKNVVRLNILFMTQQLTRLGDTKWLHRSNNIVYLKCNLWYLLYKEHELLKRCIRIINTTYGVDLKLVGKLTGRRIVVIRFLLGDTPSTTTRLYTHLSRPGDFKLGLYLHRFFNDNFSTSQNIPLPIVYESLRSKSFGTEDSGMSTLGAMITGTVGRLFSTYFLHEEHTHPIINLDNILRRVYCYYTSAGEGYLEFPVRARVYQIYNIMFPPNIFHDISISNRTLTLLGDLFGTAAMHEKPNEIPRVVKEATSSFIREYIETPFFMTDVIEKFVLLQQDLVKEYSPLRSALCEMSVGYIPPEKGIIIF